MERPSRSQQRFIAVRLIFYWLRVLWGAMMHSLHFMLWHYDYELMAWLTYHRPSRLRYLFWRWLNEYSYDKVSVCD